MEKARNHLNQNDFQGALATYLAIVKRFPGAAEAQTCLVQIGNLTLAHLGDAAAGLEHFERYLRRNPDGLLAEEAAWGKVSALSKLGRVVEERVALEEFLRQYPRSPHAARVEKRLQAISRR